MDTPSCFKKMARAFHQDCPSEIETMEDAIDLALNSILDADREELSHYMKMLIESGPEACQYAWNQSGSSIFILNVDGAITLLRAIAARL